MAKATVNEMFTAAIGEACKNADLISDNRDKAMAYAAIASALAQTGLVSIQKGEAVPAKPADAPAPTEKKTADKLKRQPKDIPPAKQEEKKPEPSTAKAKEEKPKFTEEWTDEAAEYFADGLEYIEERNNDWGPEALDACVVEFSSGALKSFEDINPMNIVAFVNYLKEIEAAEKEAATA